MKLTNLVTVGLMLAFAFASAGRAQESEPEKTDNPLYKHWSRFKPGTFVELKTVVTIGGKESTTKRTVTLSAVGKDAVVLDVSTSMEGQEKPMTAKQRIPARIVKAEKVAPAGDTEKPLEGEEVIEIAGSKIPCKWVESATRSAAGLSKSKTWSSDQVPGRIVRARVETPGEMATVSETRVVRFEVKK